MNLSTQCNKEGHKFVYATEQLEAPISTISAEMYKKVGVSVCEKCGLIRKTEL